MNTLQKPYRKLKYSHMGDISRIDASQAVEITDGVSEVAAVITSNPSGSEGGLVVRNIPSGTQSVAGTITNVPSGTQSVAGTVTVGSGVTGTINHNQKSFTTTAVQLTTASTAASYGIIIKSLTTNTAIVYVGASSVSSSNGYELAAGENVSLPVNNANAIYVIAASGTQAVSWIAM